MLKSESINNLVFDLNYNFSYVEDGTYNEELETFEYNKTYYRTLVFKLVFALIALISIYSLLTLIEWLIPDEPRHLVERKEQTNYILSIKRFDLRRRQVKLLMKWILQVREF